MFAFCAQILAQLQQQLQEGPLPATLGSELLDKGGSYGNGGEVGAGAGVQHTGVDFLQVAAPAAVRPGSWMLGSCCYPDLSSTWCDRP